MKVQTSTLLRCSCGQVQFRATGSPILTTVCHCDGEAFTKRVIASCCQTPVYLDFEKGHWFSIFRDRFEAPAPRLQMRTQTQDARDPLSILKDAPRYRTYPAGFMFRLIASKIAMDLARRSLNPGEKNGTSTSLDRL